MIINGNILEFDSLLSTQVSKEDLIKFSLSMMDVINNFKWYFDCINPHGYKVN